MTSQHCHGNVLDYDEQRGYGRICDQQGVEYFVHFRDIIDDVSLNTGDKVQFLPVLSRKGNIARQVKPL